jgi:hypothetical protein
LLRPSKDLLWEGTAILKSPLESCSIQVEAEMDLVVVRAMDWVSYLILETLCYFVFSYLNVVEWGYGIPS